MTLIRPLTPDDVAAAAQVQLDASSDLEVRLGRPALEPTEALVRRGRARVAHLQRTDPEGAWAAEQDGELVGVSLALVRDGMWFLSLLMVKPGLQGKGIGRELLDAALGTATDRSWLLSTEDPAAVRRYRRAGFVLHPSYTAHGRPDRTALPAVRGVRDHEPGDREALDDLLRRVRGAGPGPDLDYFLEQGNRVVVRPGKGFAVLTGKGAAWLAAAEEETARDLLWTVLAEAPEEVEVDWLAANQQWAVDVCLDARLSLKGGATLALRGQPPMSPYLPSGAFG